MARYHFIGIGGYGMSAVAYMLAKDGHAVQGSDLVTSTRTAWLERAGVVVHRGHDASLVDGVDWVVFGTDIPDDNVELQAARAGGIPLLHRSDVLARYLAAEESVAVTGTHGKTTVTAMLGLVLTEAGHDPTVLVGGEVEAFGGTARAGSRQCVVAEACESDGTFLRYHPHLAVITNLESDHLNFYGGDLQRLEMACRAFLYGLQPGGTAVLCWDDERVRRLDGPHGPRIVRYGFHPDAQVRVGEPRQRGWSTEAALYLPDGREYTLRLHVPGRHNIQNAAGVVAAAVHLGVEVETALGVLERYRGVKRRFQRISEPGDPVTIIDDYAHLPTEIEATLAAAAAANPAGRLIAAFQPYRYSRTRMLMDEFATAFAQADVVLVTEIRASPPDEERPPGVSGRELARRIEAAGHPAAYFQVDRFEVEAFFTAEVRPGDTVITMGVGDIWMSAKALAARLAC